MKAACDMYAQQGIMLQQSDVLCLYILRRDSAKQEKLGLLFKEYTHLSPSIKNMFFLCVPSACVAK